MAWEREKSHILSKYTRKKEKFTKFDQVHDFQVGGLKTYKRPLLSNGNENF